MQKSKTSFLPILAFFLLILVVSVPLMNSVVEPARSKTEQISDTFPRFASLKFNEVNLRAGPGRNHRIKLSYRKRGLPIEILAESAGWYKVRDFKGNTGWIGATQIASSRHAILRPWEPGIKIELRREADLDARVTVVAQSPSLLAVEQCDGNWCEVGLEGYQGWVEQIHLWGVYADENIRP